MSNITVQTTQSDVFPSNVNEASEFQYGLGIIQSHSAEDVGHQWTDNFEDPLLGLLQEHDTKIMSTEWMDTDSLGFLDQHENALVTGSHDMPLTPPTTVGSLQNNSHESWGPGCDQGPGMCRAESYTGDMLPSSPEVNVSSSEPAITRLIDLQSLLFTKRMAKTHEIDDLSTLINTTVHSTETLIDVVESLPPLKPSVEARRSASPVTCWGPAPDASTFSTNASTHITPELHDQHQRQRQQHPNLALTLSLFTTSHLLLLDTYDELLAALRARLQCSRQSQGPSPSTDFSLSQNFFNNAPGAHLNKFSLVSSFDLDVSSVVFLLSRMMKRLQKSIQDRFGPGPVAPSSDAHRKGQGFSISNASLNFDFQDGGSQDTDGASEMSPSGGHSSMAIMGDYASWEVSQRHQSVTESLRVIRWLADEL